MKITVTDTNIFIDLIHFDWLGHLISLKLEIYTTEYVLLELHDFQREKLEMMASNGQLIIHQLNEPDIAEIEMADMPRAFSPTDRSVVWLAQKYKAMVLTGDAPVRKYCEKTGLEVHGIIWVFDILVEKEIMPPAEAAECLEKLMAFNKRLPFQECEKRIGKWRK